MKIKTLIKNVYWDFRNFLFPKNVVKIKSLSKGYHDPDEMLLYSSFQIFIDFVEKELIPNNQHNMFDLEKEEKRMLSEQYDTEMIDIELKGMKDRNNITKEIMFLYIWWKHQRNLRKSPLEEYKKNNPSNRHPFIEKVNKEGETVSTVILDDAYTDVIRQNYKHTLACYEEDTKMLVRLINVREALWI